MKTYHLTWATQGRQPAFSAEEVRRAVLRAIASVAGRDIALFAIVDDHVHIVVIVTPERLARVQGALSRVLNNRSAAPFSAPFVRPVTTRSHMASLVAYCLKQFEHHGLADDPSIATGSCFPDLIGARRIPGLTLRISTALPRFQLREAHAAVGLSTAIVPADDTTVRGLGPRRLAQCVAHVFAVDPAFVGNTVAVVAARRVAVRLALQVGMRPRDIADALHITPIAAARLATRPVEEADLRAVRKRVALQDAAAARPRPPLFVREPGRLGDAPGPISSSGAVAVHRGAVAARPPVPGAASLRGGRGGPTATELHFRLGES